MTTMDQSGQGTPTNVVPTEDGQQTDAPTAWLIRAGKKGQRYDYNIEHGLVGLGFGRVPDLRGFSSRQELADTLRLRSPDATDGSISNRAGKLWRLRTDVRVGDLVVMPRMAEQIALGTVTREYWYDDSDPDADLPHVVSVEWKRADMSRAAIKEDLLRSLPPRGTISAITRNDAPWRLQQLLETGRDPGARVGGATGSSGLGLDLAEEHDRQEPDLSTLIEQFRIETGYPTADDEEQKRLREEWADKLAPENVAQLTREDLLACTNNAVDYGMYVDRREGLRQQWIIDLDDVRYGMLLDSIRDLCWGPDELSTRIDRLADQRGGARRDTGTKGFSGINVSRALAICFPERFLPLTSQIGKWGREQSLRALGLPETKGSYGQRVVQANDRLRDHLAPYFKNDCQGMAAFLNWLRKVTPEDKTPSAWPRYPESLDQLAETLLVEVEFLKDIVELLRDKGQVILYGPPGTGKTYLARELAKELAPEESRRALVQFHPSTSYEDFFEGYRPAGTGDDGGIRYELTPGPLKRMAERASEAPDEQHVMIIDEINRGNLPRVLGELLFLLEYRDESVNTLYRPDETFSLPENLWFIGTMNTADRSIALVDAALRRRFHFVPFFPDSGPMAGLLGRWLARQGEPAWVGELVDAVNRELKDVLEGSHLLLGPSHFMKAYRSTPSKQHQRLRRIWEYNIEPFIEDQFFGDPVQIKRFRFNAVMDRYGPPAEPTGYTADDLGPPGDDEATDDEDAFERADEAVGADDAFEEEGT